MIYVLILFIITKEEINMKKYVPYLLLVVSCLSMVGCTADPDEVTFSLAELGNNVNFHTDLQKNFWNDTDFDENLSTYGMGMVDNANPLPITLNWSVTSALSYTVQISENSDMTNGWSFTSKKKNFDLYNCKIRTTYYWTVTATYKSHSFTSEVSSFSTSDIGPRNIYADGVMNIRDIGGYQIGETANYVKQGMIYRCAKLNESSVLTPTYNITENGIQTMVNQLGIKSDIDLRKVDIDEDGIAEIGGITSSPLGDNINYYSCPLYYDGTTVIEHTNTEKNVYNKANIVRFFDYLAEETNYPMIFHCTQGKDRTGALAYVLESLLNVNSNNTIHDYLFTNLSDVEGSYCKTTAVTRGFDLYINRAEGTTFQEKTYNYLTSIGVSASTLDAVIDILS